MRKRHEPAALLALLTVLAGASAAPTQRPTIARAGLRRVPNPVSPLLGRPPTAAALPPSAAQTTHDVLPPRLEAAPAPHAAAGENPPSDLSSNTPVTLPDRATRDARAFDGNQPAREAREDLLAPTGRDDGGIDVLASERPRFSPLRTLRIKEIDRALTAAVAEAASELLGGQTPVEVISRGSTSRKTYVSPTPDYDISVGLPESWSAAEFDAFLNSRSQDFKAALSRSSANAGTLLFPGRALDVSVTGPGSITDAATHIAAGDVALFHLRVEPVGAGEYLKVDVTLTRSPSYANPYPQYFEDQLRQVAARDGARAAERLLDDIRLAKLFFKKSLGSYKFYQGGPSGVGIEQMVMQSGRVLDADRARTVLETGSFDRMMERLYDASHDVDGRLRTFEDFQAAWTVHNAFMEPANFLSLMTRSWKPAARAAKAYRDARLAGRPIALDDLNPGRQDGGLVQNSGRTARSIAIELQQIGRGRGIRKIIDRLQRLVGKEVLMTREFRHNGLWSLRLRVPPERDTERYVTLVKSLFPLKKAVSVLSISQEGSEGSAAVIPAPAPAPQPPPAVDKADAPGALTLGMLERFATSGPRPAERGEAYLYAQGAKTLPPGLEASWSGWTSKPLPAQRRAASERVLLLRRQADVYVLVPSIGDDGENTMRRVPVDPALAQGIVSDTLVEISRDDGGLRALRPIGAYPQDMMVGRVRRRGGELRLEGLFRDGKGRTSSLYEPLGLKDGLAVQDGTIVQAFVRPTASGYEAVPLIDLGMELTPEIAAREIALRRGARGYFDEAVVLQAEAAARAADPAGDYARIKKNLERSGGRAEDLRDLPFVTIDPPGAGDLDDAYHIAKRADGGYTWLLATSNVAHYVRPGTPAFRAAARIGNTFYSIDKDGVGEYPMNHPVVSKNLASLLDGQDSLAMITRMSFDANGSFLLDQSEVFLGLVRVKGRYTYDQVAKLWRGEPGHGVGHLEQISLARELSGKLTRLDVQRGKMNLTLDAVEHVKTDGRWTTRKAVEDPLLGESHHLIEELKVYGNRVIAVRLTDISRERSTPHISRVHPEQKEAVTLKLRNALKDIGAPWNTGTLFEYLEKLQGRRDLSPDIKQVAQWLVLTSRQSARYAAVDEEGHEGLALGAGDYDHPSAPIRRFADMYNRALLEASLKGDDPKNVLAAVLEDLKSLGFRNLEDYLTHLNGREQATRQMDYEVDAFMSLVELAKPENAGKTFQGHVRLTRGGRNPSATVDLEESAATVIIEGPGALSYKLLDRVEVTVRGVDLGARRLDATVVKVPRVGKARN